MAKIRAYKLAEELGIEKTEFVEKVKAFGIELRGPTSALEEEQIVMIREKLGEAEKSSGKKVDEKRVVRKGGGAVIRRRRRVEPEPEPEPEPVVVAETSTLVAEPESAEPADGPPASAEPVAEPVAAAAPSTAPSTATAPATAPSSAPTAKSAQDGGGDAGENKYAGRGGAQQPAGPAGAGKGKQR